jgi:hypothetical protein
MELGNVRFWMFFFNARKCKHELSWVFKKQNDSLLPKEWLSGFLDGLIYFGVKKMGLCEGKRATSERNRTD